ncbi:MAG: hypothetical protein ACOC5T_09945 [Elusimicrobiota bacterium]
MPEPREDESKDKFIKRCIPYVINEGTAKDGSQARAICESIWDDSKEENSMGEYEEFSFLVSINKTEEKIDLSDCEDCEEDYEIKENRAVALVGDRFYKGAFLSAKELKKAHKGWENTLHDINHQGTTDIKGLTATSNILYFVGYNNNVRYDEKSKSMIMDIHIVDKTHYASAWRGYIELCEKSGQTPNVSVSFMAKTKSMKVSDLPEDVDYKAYGLSKEDSVVYIYDIQPQALSTVFRGACNDKDGCGIGMRQKHSEDSDAEGDDAINEKERQEREKIISWLKEHE